MDYRIKLDIACDNLRKAIKSNSVVLRNEQIEKKWIELARVKHVIYKRG